MDPRPTPSWHDYFMAGARWASIKSKDRRTQCGAMIVADDGAVLTTGWNGFPRGVNDDVDARHERPAKYLWTEHAERNAIYNAVRRGVPLLDSTIYVTQMPCCECARAIVQAGIVRVVTMEPDWNDPHTCATQHLDVSRAIFSEAGVGLDFIPPCVH